MAKILDEIKRDLKFIQTHTLQPKWYKILKIFLVLGFLLVYYILFGLTKMILFFAIFIFLSFVVHMVYRIMTDKYTKSWLDFIVVEENNEKKPTSIGVFYYSAVVFNAIIAILLSQLLG